MGVFIRRDFGTSRDELAALPIEQRRAVLRAAGRGAAADAADPAARAVGAARCGTRPRVGADRHGSGHRPADRDHLLTRGLAGMFPQAWSRFNAGGGHAPDLPDAYARLLADPATRDRAARDWCDLEDAIVPTGGHNPRYDDPRFRLGFARIVTHHWRHGSFLADGQLLRDPRRTGRHRAGRPGPRRPPRPPWPIHHAWPSSRLVLVDQVDVSLQDLVSLP